jgi:hypothetical protein
MAAEDDQGLPASAVRTYELALRQARIAFVRISDLRSHPMNCITGFVGIQKLNTEAGVYGDQRLERQRRGNHSRVFLHPFNIA